MRSLTIATACAVLAVCLGGNAEVQVLTADGFDDAVASGKWLIELCVRRALSRVNEADD